MSDQQVASTPLVLFCSSADADHRFKQELEKHLKILIDQGVMTFWSHDQLQPSDEVAQVIQEQCLSASVFLLLLSSDYFDSDQCQSEMEHALERQQRRTARVFLILVRPCPWEQHTRLQALSVLPDLNEPVTLWRNRDQAWLSIVRSLCQRLCLSASAFTMQRPAPFQARDLPAGYVPRPAEFNAVKRLLVSETSARTPTAITTALRGAGGFGKTTLAQKLCHDPDIQATFAGGILWVTLGETPPKPLGILKNLIASLSGKGANVNTLEQAEARLRDLLETRACLIVLDDVWAEKDLTPFPEGGPRCARLITTRDSSVLPPMSQRVLVDAMREEEALQLLCSGLPESIQGPEYAEALKVLVRDLGKWPLLLTLANSALKEQVESHQEIGEALADLRTDYEAEGVVAFDRADSGQRNTAVERSLAVSLRRLDGEDALRYRELAVFPEDVEIPLETVERLWQATGGLDRRRVRKLCLRLGRLSLLLSVDLGNRKIRLHDVVRNYLLQKTATQLAGFHRAFLDAYYLSAWADLSLAERYLWDYLFFHLKAAGKGEELLATARDWRYLAKKAFRLDYHTIEADLQEALAVMPRDQALERLRARIAQIGHLLNRSETLVNVQCLFLSYLCDLEGAQEQSAALEKQIDGVYVRACHSLATSFPNMLYRTLEGHTDSVYGCAISNDGKFIVSASFDKTLKIWSRETGEIVRTLQGHTDRVSGCAISTDGKWIVSASWDGTLKIWDRETGELVRTLKGHTGSVNGCAISTDGKFIVSASFDETLKIWNRETGKIVRTLRWHSYWVNRCAISPDGRWVVSASWDWTLKIWNCKTGKIVRTLEGHKEGVNGCAISPDGKFIVSASTDGTIKIWSFESGEIVRTLSEHTNIINGCAISADGQWVVSASLEGILKVWEMQTGKCLCTLFLETPLHDIHCSSESPYFAVAGDAGVYFFQLVQGNPSMP